MGRHAKLDPKETLALYREHKTIGAVQRVLAKRGIEVAYSTVWYAIQKTPQGARLLTKNARYKEQSRSHLRRIGLDDSIVK